MESLDLLTSLQSSSEHFNIEKSTNYLHMKCQRHSLLFLTTYAYQKITNSRLRVLFPFTDSFYCVDSLGSSIKPETVQKIDESIKSFIKSNRPIEYVKATKKELAEYFKKIKCDDKVVHLRQSSLPEIVECVKFENFIDLTYGTHYETDVSKLGEFQLYAHDNGFFIYFPPFFGDGTIKCGVPNEMENVSRFFKWCENNHYDSAEKINSFLQLGECVNEIDTKVQKFDEENLDRIVESLVQNFPKRRVIAVSGCSSAGKSTFSKLIKKHIEEKYNNEYECQILPMDNYFMNRDERPLDENGNIDYESMRIILIDLLGSRIDELLDGKEIPQRSYDYVDGVGNDLPEKMSLNQKGFLIVEGLHTMNPLFLSKITKSEVLKIYISPIAPLSIDCEHIIDPHDVLLFRRILRDYNQRGTSPRDNIEIWPSVEAGFCRYLSSLIESADICYTDQMVYEMNAIQYAVSNLLSRYLNPVEKNPQVADEVTYEVKRLSLILSLFVPLNIDNLPDRLLTKQLSSDTIKSLSEDSLLSEDTG